MADKPEAATINLSEWQSTIACYLRAMAPALFLQSAEETRVIDQLVEIVQWLGLNKCGKRKLLIWSECSLQEIICLKEKEEEVAGGKIRHDYAEFLKTVTTFGSPEDTKPVRHHAALLVIVDPQSILSNSQNVRALKETLNEIRGSRKAVILIGRAFQLPKELQADIPAIPFNLPTEQHLLETVSAIVPKYPKAKGYENVVIDNEQIKPFARACTGITEQESRTLLGLALAKFAAFDARAVELALKEKERIVKRSEVLECQTIHGSLQQIGGLENVKAWVHTVTPILQNPDAARAYGLDLPSGLLCTGISGTGKTLLAKMLAAHWKLPLLRFDVGRAFGSLLGQTEGNVREVFTVANASAPCILFIDEIEKALGGDSMDGGASSRVMASILTYLEEKPDNVFVVATANNLKRLQHMPELIQRFANIFFVDLPALEARADIISIHLAPEHSLPRCDLVEAARSLRGFSGREIRNVVRAAKNAAFIANAQHPCVADLVAAAKGVVPSSEMMKEPIAELQRWCKDGRAVRASSATLEEEDAIGAIEGKAEFGVPDLLT